MSTSITLHAAERTGPINPIGDWLYKVFGTGRDGQGRPFQATILVSQGEYEGHVAALSQGTPATHVVHAKSVLAIQIVPE